MEKDCNEKAISTYIGECVPKKTNDQREWDYYFNECNKQARIKFCREMKYLIIKGKKIPCDEITDEKLKELCDKR